MKIFKNTLLIASAVLSFLVAVMVAAVVIIWFYPSLIITENNIKKALTYAPAQLYVQWEKLDVTFENLRWNEKRVLLNSADLCVEYKPQLSTCVPTVKIDVSFAVQGFKPVLTNLGELSLHISHLDLQLPKKTEPTEPTSLLPDLRLPSFASLFPRALDLKKLGQLNITLDQFRLLSPEKPPLQATARLQRNNSAPGEQVDFSITAQASQENSFTATLMAQGILNPQSLTVQGRTSVTTSSFKIQTPLDLAWAEVLTLKARPEFQVKIEKLTEKFRPQVALTWSQSRLELRAGPASSKKIWLGGELRLSDCYIVSALHVEKGFPSEARLNCVLAAKPRKKIQNLHTVETRLSADVRLRTQGAGDAEVLTVSGSAGLEGETAFLTGTLSAQGEAEIADLSSEAKLAKAVFDLTANLKIPDFTVWKDLFEKTPYAIPAPLHVLKGEVLLQAEAHLPDLKSPLSATAQLQTRLASKTQKLWTQTEVTVKTSGPMPKPVGMHVTVQSTLEDIRLEAPPLRLEPPPQALPDKRFVLKAEPTIQQLPAAKASSALKDKLPFALTWTVGVKTAQPIQILSSLLPQNIPVAMDLHIEDSGLMKGTVAVQSFPFEIFRKKAVVKNVDLIFHANSHVPELSGQINYANPEVDIRILLLGSLEKPRIEFESDPPLNRQQIVSVLLFNKSLDELNEEEVNSTASMSRAMSDGAFGLFSLLFLSSTPIQSVSYNPVTKSYTARVRLDDSTTLSMGSDFSEERQFTVRRRLGGPWSIRTELRQTDERPDVVLTLLEWLKRF
ncbi:translocation/assembly module TamB [Bdellovibrio bacteriovorus]|uniref:translocation/assembly module TamB n=1 Tax=Bdellovibrio bacteriovorus TaxID=959 RepID=UPI0021D0D24D|nr:translocation/assembly module TamB [Bdellovibrio bacteriovorus]UXR63883.1 translocation/assembly module TamB [Bdellovibrio bacteriovorus]